MLAYKRDFPVSSAAPGLIRGTQQSRTVLETPEMRVLSSGSDDRSGDKGYALPVLPELVKGTLSLSSILNSRDRSSTERGV